MRSEVSEDGLTEALFSDCGRYRYWLAAWIKEPMLGESTAPVIGFCCHNPSIAGALKKDASFSKMYGYAQRWGARRFIIVNPYAGIATQKRDLWKMENPVEANLLENSSAIIFAGNAIQQAGGFMVMASGIVDAGRARAAEVASHLAAVAWMIRDTGCPMRCLGTNADGSGRHPLYLPSDTPPSAWSPPRRQASSL